MLYTTYVYVYVYVRSLTHCDRMGRVRLSLDGASIHCRLPGWADLTRLVETS